MKKLTFGLMGFAALSLAVATLFTSCKKDDVKEIASISATLDGSSFSATAAATTSDADSKKLGELLKDNGGKTTNIYGVNTSGEVLSIVLNGNTKGTYDLSLSVEGNPTTLLINYLTTGDLEETAKSAISASANTMIVYKKAGVQSANTGDFYVSTKASVEITSITKVGTLEYIKGKFTATLENANGNKLEITDGKFSCPGK